MEGHLQEKETKLTFRAHFSHSHTPEGGNLESDPITSHIKLVF